MNTRKSKMAEFIDDAKSLFYEADAAMYKFFAQVPELIQKATNLKETNYNLGLYHMNNGNFGDAIFRFKIYSRFVPDDMGALYNIGYCYLQKGNARKAVEAFEKILAVRPDSPEVLYMMAIAGARKATAIPYNIVEQYFERLAPVYRQECVRLGYRGHTLLLDSLLKSPVEISFPLEILDIGCGAGMCGEVLRGYAKRLVGVDISQGMVDEARKLVVDGKPTYDELHKSELHAYMAGEQRKFDLVSAAHVFHFVGDLQKVFELAAKVLNPRGFFAFSVDKAEQGVADYALVGPSFYHAEGYIRTLAEKAGFEIVSLMEVDLMNVLKGYQCLLRKK